MSPQPPLRQWWIVKGWIFNFGWSIPLSYSSFLFLGPSGTCTFSPRSLLNTRLCPESLLEAHTAARLASLDCLIDSVVCICGSNISAGNTLHTRRGWKSCQVCIDPGYFQEPSSTVVASESEKIMWRRADTMYARLFVHRRRCSRRLGACGVEMHWSGQRSTGACERRRKATWKDGPNRKRR